MYVAPTVGVGNFGEWAEGPALPEPRSDASTIAVSGIVYVIGGRDADGAPTTTVFRLVPDPQTGVLDDWQVAEELVLPEGRAGAGRRVDARRHPRDRRRGPGRPRRHDLQDPLRQGRLPGSLGAGGVRSSRRRPTATPPRSATTWCYGAVTMPTGPVGAVQIGDIGLEAAEGLPENPDEGKLVQWRTNDSVNMPAARDDAAGWSANGTIYSVGGTDGGAPQPELYWAIPNADATAIEWKHLEQSDLPTGISGGAAVVTGPNAVIVGGETAEGVVATSVRANTAPQAPFFQLGLVGATVPGLKIEGEIGQQLGYLNAAGAGTVNFIILLLIGWGFAHKEQARGASSRGSSAAATPATARELSPGASPSPGSGALG